MEMQAEYLVEAQAGIINVLGDGWLPLGQLSNEMVVTPEYKRRLIIKAWQGSLYSPIIRAGLDIHRLFIFGQGVTIQAEDENVQAIIDAFWDERTNQRAFTGTRAIMQAVEDAQIQGELFLQFHPVGNQTRVRVVPSLQITETVTRAGDKDEPLFYIRTWADEERSYSQAFPDMFYQPVGAQRLTEVNGFPIDWERPIYRVGMNEWGIPTFTSAMAWAREYERFLEHRATVYAAHAEIARVAKSKTRAVMAGALGNNGQSRVAGSTAVLSPDDSLEPLRTANSITPPSEGLQFLELVAAAFGFPIHTWGKEEPGGLGQDGRHKAFFLRIEAEREAWKQDLLAVFYFVIERAAVAGQLRGVRVVQRGDSAELEWGAVDPTIHIEFPPIQDEDAHQTLADIIAATTLNGQVPTGHISPRQFMSVAAASLGLEVDLELVPEFWPSTNEQTEAFMEALREAVAEQD